VPAAISAPAGRIRSPYEVIAPDRTMADPDTQPSTMCGNCHALGPRVVGKQTQTALEWREDFNKRGLDIGRKRSDGGSNALIPVCRLFDFYHRSAKTSPSGVRRRCRGWATVSHSGTARKVAIIPRVRGRDRPFESLTHRQPFRR
jgi:hypothetical protein